MAGLAIGVASCCACLAGPPGARAEVGVGALAAPAAALIEADTGEVIYTRNGWQPRAIASTTKLMTAYVTLEHASLERTLTVQPYTPAPEETIAGLTPGERVSVMGLLEAMLLPSGGDAANTLAVDIGGSVPRFLAWMNAAARRLGMLHTHYATPVGLDTPGNYSSPDDLAQLARALMRNPRFAAIVALPRARLRGGLTLVNANDLVGRYPYVIGVKTGHTTDAGYCLVGAARRGGVTVISVVLGEPSEAARDRDTLALLDHGLSLFRRVAVITRGRVYARVPVGEGPGARLGLVARDGVSLVVRVGAHLRLRVSGVPARLEGPLRARTRLGEVLVTENGRVVAHTALINRDPLPAGAPQADSP